MTKTSHLINFISRKVWRIGSKFVNRGNKQLISKSDFKKSQNRINLNSLWLFQIHNIFHLYKNIVSTKSKIWTKIKTTRKKYASAKLEAVVNLARIWNRYIVRKPSHTWICAKVANHQFQTVLGLKCRIFNHINILWWWKRPE